MKERSGRCSDGHLSMHRDPSFTDVELAKLSHHTEHHPVDFDFASTVFFNTTAIESTSAAVAACAACLCSDAELAAALRRCASLKACWRACRWHAPPVVVRSP